MGNPDHEGVNRHRLGDPVVPVGAAPRQGVDALEGTVGNGLVPRRNLDMKSGRRLVGRDVLHRQPVVGAVGPVVGEHRTLAARIAADDQAIVRIPVIAERGGHGIPGVPLVGDQYDTVIPAVERPAEAGLGLAFYQAKSSV